MLVDQIEREQCFKLFLYSNPSSLNASHLSIAILGADSAVHSVGKTVVGKEGEFVNGQRSQIPEQ